MDRATILGAAKVRPLENVVVLDFSTLLPGPLASLLLAEAGAEVIKVERPGSGDDMRGYEPSWGTDSATFSILNRGKQSVSLDLKDPASAQQLRPLIERADILIEQFRPGVMDRLGLGYKQLAEINPRLIYCSITAYGQSGPKRDAAGHDINIIAETGLLSLTKPGAGEAGLFPTPLADIAGGSYPAVMNILLALRERERSAAGRYLDIALADNTFTLAYWALAQGWATGTFPRSGKHLVTGASPRYRLYNTADGAIVAAAPLEPKFWERFCDLLRLAPSLRDDARDQDATAAGISKIIASEHSDVWARRFAACDCCCSVAVDIEAAVRDPHFLARGVFAHHVVNEFGAKIPALPVPIDPGFRLSPDTPARAPTLGSASGNLLSPSSGKKFTNSRSTT